MSTPSAKHDDAARRFGRIVFRERLRVALMAVGAGLVLVGGATALSPFGPPISNPAVIPKADPDAGLGLLQLLSSHFQGYLGGALAVVGLAAVLCSMLLAKPRSQGGHEQ